MVFHILEDVNILSTDTFIDFCLEFTVHKVGELGINLKIGNTIFICGTFDTKICGLNIIQEVHVLCQLFFCQKITLGNSISFEIKAMLIHVSQMFDNLIGEFFSAGACYNGKICGFRIGHESTSYVMLVIVMIPLFISFVYSHLLP